MTGYAHSRHPFVPKLFLLSGYRPMSIGLGSCLLDDAHVHLLSPHCYEEKNFKKRLTGSLKLGITYCQSVYSASNLVKVF